MPGECRMHGPLDLLPRPHQQSCNALWCDETLAWDWRASHDTGSFPWLEGAKEQLSEVGHYK
jgi:hypothetical protein